MRFLDRFSTLRMRFGVIIVIGVGAAVAIVTLGRGLGVSWAVSAIVGIAVALGLVQLVAHGTTRPLREMEAAASAFAEGDYSRRVNTRARDEVGRLAESFNFMADELASVDRFRRDLVANASHELRTPIAVARAVLENVVDGVQPATPETLRPVLGQVERLGRLVDQLLDLSRLESGSIPFQFSAVDLRAILEEAAESARLRGAPNDIDVIVTGDPCAHGDEERLRQVVMNLLDNALRHAPSGTAVQLLASALEGGRLVELRVVDEGPGVAPEDATRIFERFTRLDDARSSDDGGSGLGLSIVKWIVDHHHGTIRAERLRAEAPYGCAMTVELPLAAPP